jgi:hypothetical protein
MQIDLGRQDLAEGDFDGAKHRFLVVDQVGHQLRSDGMRFGALLGQSELHRKRKEPQQARDYCVAALLAWPHPYHLRPFVRAYQLGRHLDLGAKAVHKAIYAARLPVSSVVEVPGYDQGRVKRLVERLSRQGI